MNTFSIGESIRFGWNTFKKRPWFFVGATVVLFFIDLFISMIAGIFERGNVAFIGSLFNLIAGIFVAMGVFTLYLKAHNAPMSARIADLWHPHSFWNFAGSYILFALIVGIPTAPFLMYGVLIGTGFSIGAGSMLPFFMALIPAIVIALIISSFFGFSIIIALEKNTRPITALKESLRITKGYRLQLFLFFAASMLIVFLGLCAIILGLLIAVPVTLLAFVHVYRTLSANTPVPTA